MIKLKSETKIKIWEIVFKIIGIILILSAFSFEDSIRAILLLFGIYSTIFSFNISIWADIGYIKALLEKILGDKND